MDVPSYEALLLAEGDRYDNCFKIKLYVLVEKAHVSDHAQIIVLYFGAIQPTSLRGHFRKLRTVTDEAIITGDW